jgi:hypothetical protein
MKIRTGNSSAGSLLIATLIVSMLVGVVLTAYLALISQQQTFTQRSQVWNHCISMCEAGVEEAMAHLNHSTVSNKFDIHGWRFEKGAYRKERDLNYGTCFIAIDTNLPPIITVAGGLRAPLHTAYITRTVAVQTKYNQQFPNAILAKGGINMNGSARIDSFNSTNDMENTNGQYDPDKATDHASVATISQTPGDVNIGNVDLYGSIATGPGGTVQVGPNGSVGSEEYVDSGANGGSVESGHSTDDVNVYIEPAKLPEGWGEPAPPASGDVGGTKYSYVLRDGDYQIGGDLRLGSKDVMIVVGKARLYVTGSTSFSGQGHIEIASGGSVEFYSGGNMDMTGGAIQNSPGYAKNFSIIGLEGCTEIKHSGNGTFVGTIYAPTANITMTGNSTLIGAVVANSIKVRGNMEFHYDEALRTDPKRGRFFISWWKEL